MQTGLFTDIVSRPETYWHDLRRCTPVSFNSGGIAFTLAMGISGGLPYAALPAAAVQLCGSVWPACEQIRATYRGEKYDTPFRRQIVINWVTATAMVCGTMAFAGTPVAMAVAAISTIPFLAWGLGNLFAARMIRRMETLRKKARKQGEGPQEDLEADPYVRKLTKQYQALFGVADCSTIFAAAAKTAETSRRLQAIPEHMLRGIAGAGSILPLVFFAGGLVKSLSRKKGILVDRILPRFVRRHVKTKSGDMTPNRYYALGYGIAGVGAFIETFLGSSPVTPVIVTKALCLLAAYEAWSHGYVVLDEPRPVPASADVFAARKKTGRPAAAQL